MNLRRIAALALRIVLQFRRDRRTVGFLVVVPVVVLSLLAYLINLAPGALHLGVVREDPSPFAQRLVDELKQSPGLDIREVSRQEAGELLRRGDLQATIFLPQGFAATLAGGDGPKLAITLEGAKASARPMVAQALSRAIARLAAAQSGVPSIEPEFTYVYAGPDYGALDYFAPTFIAFFAFFFVYLLTAIGFLRERTQGTWERLLASPLRKVEMVLGYMAGYSIFALLQAAIILLFTVYVIRINYSGNLFIVFIIVAIMAVGSVNLGIFLSTFARTELQAVQFIPLIIVPQALLGGIIWPIENMNRAFQWLAHILPMTYANFALQEVMIKGRGVFDAGVAADIGALLLFAAAMVALASVGLRRASS